MSPRPFSFTASAFSRARPAEWYPVEKFNAADELLEDPSLKVVFKMAVEEGCAVVNENDGELKKGK